MPRLCFVALCGAAISAAGSVAAQPAELPPAQPTTSSRPAAPTATTMPAIAGTLRFSWVRARGADQCPGPNAVTDAVESRLARAVFSSSAAQSIEAIVSRADNQWSVELYLRNVDGTLLGSRTLSSERAECEAAVEAAVFAITLALDPDADPETSPQNTPESSAAIRGALSLARAVTDAPRAPVATTHTQSNPLPARADLGAVSLGAWASFGALPALSSGASLHGYVRVYRRFGVRTWLRFLPEQRSDTTTIGGVSFGLTTVSLGGDVELIDLSRFALSVSLGPTVGAMHAVPHDRAPADSGQRAFFALTASAIGAIRLVGPLSLDVGIEADLPITRYRFGLESTSAQGATVYSPVFEQPWLAAGAWIALGARFR